MQLNLASGRCDTPLAGWVTVDRFAWPVNVTADFRSLPFASGSVRHVHLSHAIEHIPPDHVVDALAEIRRVLEPSGILYCSGPDMTRTAAIGSTEWKHYTEHGGSPDGWGHAWTCSVELLRAALLLAGFVPTWAKAIPTGWPPNTHSWPLDLETRFVCRRDDYPWTTSFPVGFTVQT